MSRLRLALVVAAAFLSACGDAPVIPVTPEDDGAIALNTLSRGKVFVQDSGVVSKILGCSGICAYQRGFWVDLSVANDSFEKEVAVVWTVNGWSSHTVTAAQYELTQSDGREQWGVDVDLGQSVGSAAQEVEYAVYVKMNGVTSWDPLNNHYIRESVTRRQPVRLLNSGVSYLAGQGVLLSGTARVLNVAFNKEVSVRYSTDGWLTSHDARATWSRAQDWTFVVSLGAPKPLPAAVEFAVHYQTEGVDAWDSKGGENYRHVLRPVFQLSSSLPSPISGIVTLAGHFQTDLPRESLNMRVDAAAWKATEYLTFSTFPLSDGSHTAHFRQDLVGGHQEYATAAFGVKNRIQPLGGWDVPQAATESEYPWDSVVGADGKVYVLWSSQRVARSEAFGTTVAPFLYPEVTSAHRIAVDSAGRLYVMVANGSPAVTRFTPAGVKDATFAEGGTLSLAVPFEGSSVCFAAFMTVAGSRIVVSDSCNGRLLLFGMTGVFEKAISAGEEGISQQVFFDGVRLWAPYQSKIARWKLTNGNFVREASLAVAGTDLNGVQGLVRTANGLLWIVDNSSLLAVNGSTGALESRWLLGDSKLGLLGEGPLARNISLLPDGTVAVLAVTSERMERYSSTLK